MFSLGGDKKEHLGNDNALRRAADEVSAEWKQKATRSKLSVGSYFKNAFEMSGKPSINMGNLRSRSRVRLYMVCITLNTFVEHFFTELWYFGLIWGQNYPKYPSFDPNNTVNLPLHIHRYKYSFLV